jgi:hypothetical protein
MVISILSATQCWIRTTYLDMSSGCLQYNSFSPMVYAAFGGNIPLLHFLLEAKANLNGRDGVRVLAALVREESVVVFF